MMLAGLVFIFLGGFLYLGALYILGFLYLRGFDALGFLYCFFDFMLLGCFFDFLGVLIFGFFYSFLWFFGFFYDFFCWLLLCFYSPKLVQSLKFSCNSFFLEYTGWRGCGDAVNVTAYSLRLYAWYLTDTCKSIKKYKNMVVGFFKPSMFTGCMIIFLGSTNSNLTV